VSICTSVFRDIQTHQQTDMHFSQTHDMPDYLICTMTFCIQKFLLFDFLQVISQIQSIEGLNGNNFDSNIQEYSVSQFGSVSVIYTFSLRSTVFDGI